MEYWSSATRCRPKIIPITDGNKHRFNLESCLLTLRDVLTTVLIKILKTD